jgi:hypothetical protein
MKEPSVLDYVKSKLFFWRGQKIEIPPWEAESSAQRPSAGRPDAFTPEDRLIGEWSAWDLLRWAGWWVLMPLGLALLAQRALEPPSRSLPGGVTYYVLALVFLVWSHLRARWQLPRAPDVAAKAQARPVRWTWVWASIAAGLAAFLAFGGNQFNQMNLILWSLALIAFWAAFWQPRGDQTTWRARLGAAVQRFKTQGITFPPWTLLVLAVFTLAAFFRFYHLAQVPPEMFSDHAEKLLDVADVLDGITRIFFPRNTGREAFQIYLTAAVARFFGTGLSFISLKIGTALAGLFTLPYIYLLGKGVANRRVGLLSMAFAGVAYWPNVISRVALRFTLYPFFAAPTLYYLVRGLRRGRSNDFILAGLFLGLGLHGYSTYRFMPIVVLAGVVIYLLHQRSGEARRQGLRGLVLLAFLALLVFLPLLRYALANMDMFNYRTLTRMTAVERSLPGPAWLIFLQNLGKAMVMFFWDNGQIWVHSIPHRPALGVISAALFFSGGVLLSVRYLRKRNWLDLFLLLLVPLLLMPSVLSLAFPEENPSLNRTGGAVIPVFLMVGLGLDGLLTSLEGSLRHPFWGRRLAWGVGLLLLAGSCFQNYQLVFEDYRTQFARGAWNTSELGAVIRQFADTVGSEDSAWVVPYPHWVDTRLVGINAGVPGRDYALWVDQLPQTLDDPRVKLFLFKPEDTEAKQTLRALYPNGALQLHASAIEDKEFYIYMVPPEE